MASVTLHSSDGWPTGMPAMRIQRVAPSAVVPKPGTSTATSSPTLTTSASSDICRHQW